jgi:hypothetical protein
MNGWFQPMSGTIEQMEGGTVFDQRSAVVRVAFRANSAACQPFIGS